MKTILVAILLSSAAFAAQAANFRVQTVEVEATISSNVLSREELKQADDKEIAALYSRMQEACEGMKIDVTAISFYGKGKDFKGPYFRTMQAVCSEK